LNKLLLKIKIWVKNSNKEEDSVAVVVAVAVEVAVEVDFVEEEILVHKILELLYVFFLILIEIGEYNNTCKE